MLLFVMYVYFIDVSRGQGRIILTTSGLILGTALSPLHRIQDQ